MKRLAGRRPHRHAGFTLIELMVTVVIAAILLGVAIPSYTSHIRKSRRVEARTALLDLATREERYMSLSNAYTSSAANLGYNAFPQIVGNGYYQLSFPSDPTAAAVNTAANFIAVATPVAGSSQANDTQCAKFQVDATGKQTSFDTGGNDTTTTCWN